MVYMPYDLPSGTIHTNDKGFVTGVHLPLSPEEWFSCCARRDSGPPYSYYIGGCCGNLSAAQDILNHLMRMNSEGLSAYDIRHQLAEFHDLVRNHDGFNLQDMPDLTVHAEQDPIARILLLYETVRDGLEEDRDRPHAASYDPSRVDQALRAVEEHGSALSRSFFWIRPPEGEKPDHMSQAWRVERIRKLLPAIRTLHEYLGTLHLGDFEGWCIVDQSGEVGLTNSGAAVFGTKSEAQKTAKNWNKENERDQASRRDGDTIPAYCLRKFTIRPCTVSLENGLVVHEA